MTATTSPLQVPPGCTTALTMAIARGVHQLLDEPIVLPDPLALPILGPALEQAVRDDPFRYNDPMARTLRAAVVARSMVARAELSLAASAGVRQCVVLGAGLDTLALEAPHREQGMRYIEVDRPVTQEWKRTLMRQAGIEAGPRTSFVPADLQTEPLGDALARAAWDPGQPCCFVWLGVTPYLAQDAVEEVLALAGRSPAGSSVIFDFRVSPEALPEWERMMAGQFARQVALMGEPWRSAYAPAQLRERLHASGFSSVRIEGAADVNARFFARRKDGLQTVDGGLRLAVARR